MNDYSQDRYARLAATAFGYDGLSRNSYRDLCAAIRYSSGIDFSDWQPSWRDLTVEQQITLLDNLKHSFPGVRDGVAFLAFLRHMMVVVKGEAARRQARNSDASETSAPGVLTHPESSIASTPDGDPPHTMATSSSEERGATRSHVTDTSLRRFGLSFQVARVWPSLTADFVKSRHDEPR
jgi:hypothetical protein